MTHLPLRMPGRTISARGAVLLEAIVALAILATAASTGAWMVSEAVRSVSHAHQQEVRVRAASRFLTAVALWPREDLDRHLGTTVEGPWRMRMDRTGPSLYAVTVTDTLTGGVVLRTALYRPEPER